MKSFIRTLVSKSKRRYTENGFNLDLTCNNCLVALKSPLSFKLSSGMVHSTVKYFVVDTVLTADKVEAPVVAMHIL